MSNQTHSEKIISQIVGAIRSSLDLKTIFSIAVEEIGKLLQLDHVTISEFVSEEKGWLTVAHYRSHLDLPASVGTYILDKNNLGTAKLKQLEIFRIDDTNNCEDEVTREMVQTFPGAWLIFPLHFDSVVWGCLCLLMHRKPRYWQQEEIELIVPIADQLAIAINQSQLYQKTLYQMQREKAINKVVQAIRNSLDINAVFKTAVAEISELLQVDRAEIAQYLPEEKMWLIVADHCRRFDLTSSLGLRMSDEDNPIATRLKKLEVIRINDTNALQDETSRYIAEIYSGAWLLIPIHFNSLLWGAITLSIEGKSYEWNDTEVELTSAIVDQLAIAIEQSQLYQKVKQLAEQEISKALQRERELNQIKTQLITTIAHEINTPLTTIQTSIDILQHYSETLTKDKISRHYEKLGLGIRRIKNIVRDVLLISERTKNALQFQPEEVDIVKLCEDAIILVNQGSDNSNRIQFNVAEDVSRTFTLDPELVHYILANLLGNAVKYSSRVEQQANKSIHSLQNNDIKFDLSCTNGNVKFSIQDQGIGIPAEDLPSIFGSFYRGKNVGNLPGTGLGLAIVRQCVDLHNGEIFINSVVGEGTTVTVMLP